MPLLLKGPIHWCAEDKGFVCGESNVYSERNPITLKSKISENFWSMMICSGAGGGWHCPCQTTQAGDRASEWGGHEEAADTVLAGNGGIQAILWVPLTLNLWPEQQGFDKKGSLLKYLKKDLETLKFVQTKSWRSAPPSSPTSTADTAKFRFSEIPKIFIYHGSTLKSYFKSWNWRIKLFSAKSWRHI